MMEGNVDTTGSEQHNERPGPVSASGLRKTSSNSALRRRDKRNDRRNYHLPDALESLHPLKEATNGDRARFVAIHKIAISLVLIDVWTLNTLKDARYHAKPQFINQDVLDRFKLLSRPKLVILEDGESGSEIFEARFRDKAKDYLDQLTTDQLLDFLEDLHTSQYYSQMFQFRITFYDIAQADLAYARSTPNLSIPEDMGYCKTQQQYLAQLILNAANEKQKLRSLIKECRTLRDRIALLYESGLLDGTDGWILAELKTKMEALHENFREACAEVDPLHVEDLMNSSSPNWEADWRSESVHKSMEESPPPGAAKAQNINKSQNVNSFLSFFVPTVCLLSCIPTALAWTHTTASVGTINDANFYQLLSNTVMQLLGLFTLVWPTVFDARLATMAWFWTWILGGRLKSTDRGGAR
ncbi:hypothetical protein V498_05837 [Pseudogymnoascus sp. VKM F-4517 (FW-2822)]|nr:hypothetical protein V498_05837 [Pseudogymnoascus sp. VKM F-4517 (FW-2822)]